MPPRTLTLRLDAEQAAALTRLQAATGERTPAQAILAAIRAGARARRESADRLRTVERQAGELRSVNRRLEEALAALERAQDRIVMREKLAALGELSAGVAHELLNPLNFVKNFAEGCLELLQELNEALEDVIAGAPGPLDTGQRERATGLNADINHDLERIVFHAARAERIVRAMLTMGRSGGERRPVPFNDLVDEHARLAYHGARARDPDFDIEIVTHYDTDIGDIDAIPRDLGRLVVNLVSNACDATEAKRRAGGRGDWRPALTLSTRRLANSVELRVSDNGTGIPTDIVDKVFNPFFTTKPTNRGTGLGLALSADIARNHGGGIRVETQAGKFTEMIVDLPLRDDAPC